MQHDKHPHATVMTKQARDKSSPDLHEPNDRITGVQSKHSCCHVREKVCVYVSRLQPKLKLPRTAFLLTSEAFHCQTKAKYLYYKHLTNHICTSQ